MIKKATSLFFALCLILAISSCAPVTVKTLPTGATVYGADGKTKLGSTPFDTRVFVSEKDFVVRKARYFDAPVKLNYDSERDVLVKFHPKPVLVYSKPTAAIYPAGSKTAVGNTPKKLAVSDKAAAYTLKVADYYDKNITVGLDSPNPLVVELARRPIVTISAEPAGVQVYENGKLIGSAPVREEIQSPRTFELRKANYFTQTGTLTGAPPYEVHTVLRPFPVITVAATPADAQISRKGGLLGKGSAKLAVGEKTVLDVSANRYYTQSVTLTPESPAQVNVALKAMPYVMINSQPAGAKVRVNGKSVGTTPVEQLIEKETTVELSKDGFVTKTATLTGANKQVTLTLKKVPPPVETPAVSNATATAAHPAPAPAAPPKKETFWQKIMKFFGK